MDPSPFLAMLPVAVMHFVTQLEQHRGILSHKKKQTSELVFFDWPQSFAGTPAMRFGKTLDTSPLAVRNAVKILVLKCGP